jgi:hypothetical protein
MSFQHLLFKGLIVTALLINITSCTKNDPGGSDQSLVGKWSYQETDSQGTYTVTWTFNKDGTLLINNKYDVFNGQTVKYKYDPSTKKLDIIGIIFTVEWISATKIKIGDNTYTKIT